MGAGGSARRVAPGSDSQELALLRVAVQRLQETVAGQSEQLETLSSAIQGHSFTVGQYNILAAYLGDNRQPWFLYGISCPQERRDAILKKFYERGADGKYVNTGWPKYVDGILSADEMKHVEEVHNRDFDWSVRRDRVLEVCLSMNADLFSLVELDHYDDFFLPALAAKGYQAVYKKRPRESSLDGCGIFFRKGVFELLGSQAMELVDRIDPATGRKTKDRVGLLALLQHVGGRRLIFLSTHLARNPEDERQTKSRAKQAAQLLQLLTEFAQAHDALEVPVILAGDMNTTNIRQIANIARVVFELSDRPCHPFVFTASAPRTLPTSVTTTRKMCIDYLLVQSSIEVVDRVQVPKLSSDAPIPNGDHPSDHVPITFKLAFKPIISAERYAARSWILTATDNPNAGAAPLTRAELRSAFDFFDLEQSGGCERREVEAALSDLSLASALEPLLTVIEREIGRKLTDDGASGMSFDEFARLYTVRFCQAKTRFKAEMADTFRYFDTSGDGSLECEELYSSFMAACPFEVPRAHFDSIFQQLDANQDGTVTIDEFVDFLITNQQRAD